ncbi:hypothetical protein [Achromobacter spanius]|nr:hypothetical protein [Achromobacter spanius]
MDIREMIAGRMTDAGGRLTVRSALNPMLWLCAIVSAPSAIALGLSPRDLWWLQVLVVVPVVATVVGFCFLLIFDRDKLQSEDYQIRKRTLELMQQDKGMTSPMPLANASVITPDAFIENGQMGGDPK